MNHSERSDEGIYFESEELTRLPQLAHGIVRLSAPSLEETILINAVNVDEPAAPLEVSVSESTILFNRAVGDSRPLQVAFNLRIGGIVDQIPLLERPGRSIELQRDYTAGPAGWLALAHAMHDDPDRSPIGINRSGIAIFASTVANYAYKKQQQGS